MKNKKHIRSNGKMAARLRRELSRLGGIVRAKNNADAARQSLADEITAHNDTAITPFLMVRNGWEAYCNNELMSQFAKGAFNVKFNNHSRVTNKVEFFGNFRDNRVELRKPTITVGEINQILQMFGCPDRLQVFNEF